MEMDLRMYLKRHGRLEGAALRLLLLENDRVLVEERHLAVRLGAGVLPLPARLASRPEAAECRSDRASKRIKKDQTRCVKAPFLVEGGLSHPLQ